MTALVVGAALAAVAGLTGVVLAGRSARRRDQAAAAEASAHPHYCAGCDQEWPHVGRTCLRNWASPCPKCAEASASAPASAEVAAARSRA